MMQEYCFYILGIAAPTAPFVIPSGTSHVGSSPGCALFIDDPEIELRHLRVRSGFEENGSYEVTNLSNHRRTLLNDIQMPTSYPLTLRVDDSIQIGMHTLIFKAMRQPWAELESGVSTLDTGEKAKPKQSWYEIPKGLQQQSLRLLHYLPEIYRAEGEISHVTFTAQQAFSFLPTTFLSRFLGLFESVLLPIEWQVDNFDLFLDPTLAADFFLPWLEQWYGFTFDETWNVEQRRQLLKAAPQIFQNKGTLQGLEMLLQIYSEDANAHVVLDESQPGFFTVIIKFDTLDTDELSQKKATLENLINVYKPVMAHYDVENSSIV